MKRRNVLTSTVATGSVLLLAGCSSDNDELEEREEAADQLEEDLNQGETDTPSSNPSGTGGQALVMEYRIAYQGKEAGRELLSSSISLFADEEYGSVVSTLQGTEENLNGFGDTFSNAAESADNSGYDDVAVAARAGEAECRALANASARLREGAQLAQDGDQDAADQKISNAQSFITTADTEREDVLSPSEVEDKVQ